MNNEEKSIIRELEDIQKNLPNIIIPSMGMLENNIKVEINNEEFINQETKSKEN